MDEGRIAKSINAIESRRLNEGYKPRAPQVGDLVEENKNPNGFNREHYGVVVDKSGINVNVYWFLTKTKTWVRRTSVRIMNRGAK